ncbi:YolD-like family protein [Paenibacillus sp. 22594]|uniref:YolD-like family protein n=1 Tax=Paenibacillus sp. 22594 TaxID=3453947 RepID=UPI003F858C24
MRTHEEIDYLDPPNHDEYALQDLGDVLQEAMTGKSPTTLTVYKIGKITGLIKKIDVPTRKVHLQTETEGIYKFPVLDIWKAEPAE